MSEVITKELGLENRNDEGRDGAEMSQEKELLTWQVDLAELNLQVSHPTASTSSPQLIFLISQSFLKRAIAYAAGVVQESPVYLAVLPAHRLNSFWAVVGTGECAETESKKYGNKDVLISKSVDFFLLVYNKLNIHGKPTL